MHGAKPWQTPYGPPVSSPPVLTPTVVDLGSIDYASGLALQRDALERVVAARDAEDSREVVFLLEHDPAVITITRRPGAAAHLLASPERLAALGVEVHETDRGGDITYHGPGQLVVYPIIDLNRHGLRIHSYMRLLEDVVIATLGEFELAAGRDACATGVWVDDPIGETTAPAVMCSLDRSHGDAPAGTRPGMRLGTRGRSAKICAMGVRVSRWVSMHGLALNVSPDLEHFGLIVPCGLAGRTVTSLARELGDRAPSMATVKERLAAKLLGALTLRRQAPSSLPE